MGIGQRRCTSQNIFQLQIGHSMPLLRAMKTLQEIGFFSFHPINFLKPQASLILFSEHSLPQHILRQFLLSSLRPGTALCCPVHRNTNLLGSRKRLIC